MKLASVLQFILIYLLTLPVGMLGNDLRTILPPEQQGMDDKRRSLCDKYTDTCLSLGYCCCITCCVCLLSGIASPQYKPCKCS